MRMQVILDSTLDNPGLFFRTPGFSPYMGREERRVQGLDYVMSRTFSRAKALSTKRGEKSHGYENAILYMPSLPTSNIKILKFYDKNRN